MLKSIYRWMFYKFQYLKLYKSRHSAKILTAEETIDRIIANKISVCRFGDGEFNVVINQIKGYDISRKSGFQNFDKKLASRLIEILKTDQEQNSNCLVCLPGCMFAIGTGYLRRYAASFWEEYTYKNIHTILKLLNTANTYGDTNFSRFYLSHKNKKNCKSYLQHVKLIWQNRNILIVEGNKTLLGVGNDLFSNAKNIKRIICPPKNAWHSYDAIHSAVVDEMSKEDEKTLVICALGMTATVLAYDLAELGFQAIDIGHIDIEYEWMRMNAVSKVAVPGKFTNEAKNKIDNYDLRDNKYFSEIVRNIEHQD